MLLHPIAAPVPQPPIRLDGLPDVVLERRLDQLGEDEVFGGSPLASLLSGRARIGAPDWVEVGMGRERDAEICWETKGVWNVVADARVWVCRPTKRAWAS
jgi:hypothetical protein